MPELLVSSTLMWKGTLEQMFRVARMQGFRGIEVWSQHFEAMGFSREECLRLSSVYGMRMVVHAPSWDVNLASMSETVRQASLEETRKAVDFALLIGACELTVHPGQASPPVEKEASYETLFASLQELYEYACARGMKISLEVMEKLPVMLTSSTETMRKATRELFGKFSYTVDAAHCDSGEELFFLLRTLPGVSKIHISNRLGPKLHTPLFRGDHDFAQLLPLLFETGLPLVLEGMDTEENFPLLQSTVSFVREVMETSRFAIHVGTAKKVGAACF